MKAIRLVLIWLSLEALLQPCWGAAHLSLEKKPHKWSVTAQWADITSQWSDRYQNSELIAELKKWGRHAAGLSQTLIPEEENRLAYFFSFGIPFGKDHLLSITTAHEEYYRAFSGIDTGAITFSSIFNASRGLFFYSAVGYHRSYFKDVSALPYQPFTYNATHNEGMYHAQLGTGLLGNQWMITIDVNNFDRFHFYSADHLASDLTCVISINKIDLRTIIGRRFAGVLAGNPVSSSTYGTLGLSVAW